MPEDGGWRISGEKAFITGRFDPDYLITLANTGPDRPRRSNLGVFMVDAKSPRPRNPHHAAADGQRAPGYV